MAVQRGIRVEQPEKVKQGRLAAVARIRASDVAVVAAYGRILPADALSVPLHGCLNVHASLLPDLRVPLGAVGSRATAPQTGVTIMQMARASIPETSG